MKYLLLPLLLIAFKSMSQCTTYRLTSNGDTLNCIDQQDKRQGKWVVKVDGVRGEPGYEEEGVYIDNKKEGPWRVYTTMGDLFALENYRWGHKDGRSQYFNIAGLVREESWRATNPDNPYDTVEVPDPINPSKVEMKIVKIEGSALKHGTWKFYESGTGFIVKTENYVLGKLTESNAGPTASMPGGNAARKPAANEKPKEVLEFERKNRGKKNVKVIDGRTYQ